MARSWEGAGPAPMRIAVLIPGEDTAEAQCVASMRLAAERFGHTLDACRTSDELLAMAPDFALAFVASVPKLTDVPTYGLIVDPRGRWLSDPAILANLYTYDGYFAMTDRLHRFVRDALFAAGRREPIGRFYPAALSGGWPPLLPAAFARPRLAYFGVNWDRRRPGLFVRLALEPWMELYGPQNGWAFVDTAAYKGSVAFDGTSVLERYREAGVGLVLLSDHHLADDCPTNRIFEICAAGALPIVPRMPWYERTFGDCVLYFRQQAGDNVIHRELAAHMEWIAAHPAEAAAMAARAHEIFEREFALDYLFPNVVRYHEERVGARRALTALPHAKVSVVVRAGDLDTNALRRCLRSIAAQEGVDVEVLLVVPRSPGSEDFVRELGRRGLSFTVLEPRGDHASADLWTGLQHSTGEFVAVLDGDGEWMSGHLRSLVEAARAQSKGFAYSGSIRSLRDHARDGNLERRSLRSFSLGVLPSDPLDRAAMLPIGSYLFRRELLDGRDLVDPEMDTGGATHLTLSVLQKENPAFTFRATALGHESAAGPAVSNDARRDEDDRRLMLRFLGRPFPAPPSVVRPGRLFSTSETHAGGDLLEAKTGTTAEYGIPPGHIPLLGPEESWHRVSVDLERAQVGAMGDTRSESADTVLPLRVRPPESPWSYGALLSLPYPDAGPCVVRLRCHVLRGRAGFGVLTSDETAYIERLFVPAQSDDVVVNLTVASAERAGRLVVQTTESVEVAEVLLESVELVFPHRPGARRHAALAPGPETG